MLLTLPLSIQVTKKKKFYINLNQYRNTHFHTLNKAKVDFKELIAEQLKKLPILERVKLTYTLYPATIREVDVPNVCSIADKFFSDALVEHGKLTDDNYKFLPEVTYRYGGVDKHKPRVEVHIEHYDQSTPTKEQDPMQITLNEAEILTALENYVRKQITISEGQTIAIDLKAGRGENGFSATLDIIDGSMEAALPTPKPKPKGEDLLAAAKAKATPKVEPKPEPKAEKVKEPEPAPTKDIDPLVAELEAAGPVEEEQEESNVTSIDPKGNEIEEEAPEEEAPTEKPKSIFNFDKA